MSVLEVASCDDYTMLTGGGVSVVMFTAPWCAKCKAVYPKFTKLSGSAEVCSMKFLKVDTSKVEIPSLDIKGLPTFLVVSNGEVIDREFGNDWGVIENLVARNVSKSNLVSKTMITTPLNTPSAPKIPAAVKASDPGASSHLPNVTSENTTHGPMVRYSI
jgi:thiol-disulfide isomerase/thioredoxin